MACSNPNLMGFDWLNGYRFLGPRDQERNIRDILPEELGFIQDIPCGKCELCRVDQRYSRALRIMLEAESHPQKTYFLTLTYSEEHLGSKDLEHKDWVQFMKDFRAKFCQAEYCKIKDRGTKRHGRTYSKTFKKIKQVMCGEYGDTFGRKHFHGIIFNHDFTDMEFTGEYSKKGSPLYTSKALAEIWKKGIVQIAPIEMDLALYVSAYVTDANDDPKINDGHKQKQYGRFGNGIGLTWLKKYWKDIIRAGKVTTIEKDYPVPRYFWQKIKELHPKEYEDFKRKKFLQLKKQRTRLAKKGDGLLARSKAKGRIFTHIKQKRRIDGNGPRSVVSPDFDRDFGGQ